MNESSPFVMDQSGEPMLCCANCIAYRGNPNIPDNQGGDCRRNPPTVIVVQARMANARGQFEDHIQTLFPPVPAKEFCWQFVLHPSLKIAAETALKLAKESEGKH